MCSKWYSLFILQYLAYLTQYRLRVAVFFPIGMLFGVYPSIRNLSRHIALVGKTAGILEQSKSTRPLVFLGAKLYRRIVMRKCAIPKSVAYIRFLYFVSGESPGSSEDNTGVSDISRRDTDEDLAGFCESRSVALRLSYSTSYLHGSRYVSVGSSRCVLLVVV